MEITSEKAAVIFAKDIKMVSVGELKPYERNARTHSDEQIKQIAASIAEFGFTNPILVDSSSGIIAGHGRLEAAKTLGFKEVPVIELSHLTTEQKRAYIIADNKLALNAGWDLSLLSEELEAIASDGFDLDLIGFSQEELDGLLSDNDETEPAGDEEDVPDLPESPVSVRGDIWMLGKDRHRLMCGDAVMIDDVEKLMGGAPFDIKANLIITDPPYNVDYEGKTKDAMKIQNDNMDAESFYNFLHTAFSNMFLYSEDGAGIYVFHADTEGMNFRKALKESGFKLAQCCVWVKQSMVLGRQDYQWQHEPVLYGWKPTASHKWYSDRKQTTVWNFSRPSRSENHPTMKPIDLVSYPLLNSSRKHNIVLDLFGGSGSTLIACEKAHRRCFMMELSGQYCDVIIRRWQDYTGKKAILRIDRKKF